MVKARTIVIALLVVVVAIWAGRHLFPSEHNRVRKRFDLLSEWVSKDRGESAFTTARKCQKVRTLFGRSCQLEADVVSLSGSYTPQEIASYIASVLMQFSKLSLRFYDLEIDFPNKATADAVLTARARGTTTGGESIDEIRELHCTLKKIEDEWLFSACEVVEVLKK